MKPTCSSTSSRNPSTNLRLPRRARDRKPAAPRADRGGALRGRPGRRDARRAREWATSTRRHARPCPSHRRPRLANGRPSCIAPPSRIGSPGSRSRRPIHSETPTVTALPTSFHLVPSRVEACAAGSVQPLGKPCSRSASPMLGHDDAAPERSGRIPDRRRRRNADGRSTLERRHGVACPTDASQPLGPVEAEAVVGEVTLVAARQHRLRTGRRRGSTSREATKITRCRRWGTPENRESTSRYAHR